MRPRPDQPTLTKLFAAFLVLAVAAFFPRLAAAQAAGPDRPLEIEAISVDDLPAHVKILISAATMRLQGDERSSFGPVVLSPEALRGLDDAEFNFHGFSLNGVVLGRVDEPSDDESALELDTLLLWRDAIGRRAVTSLSLRYVPKGDSIDVTAGRAIPVSSGLPEVRLFALPIGDRTADLGDVLTDFGRLIALLNREGVDPTLRADTNSNFVLFAVVADRLPASESIRVVAGDSRSDRSSDGPDSAVIDIDGWRVGVFLVPAGEAAPRFLKVYYRPSPVLSAEDEPEERLVALFPIAEETDTSKRNTAPPPPPVLAAPLIPRKSDDAGSTAGAKPANTFQNLLKR